MKYILPQEIQVWYILPVIRRELSRVLVKEKGLSQKKTAKMLSLTEGAVSQYLNAKRGNVISLPASIMKEVTVSAETIQKDDSRVMEEMIRLLNLDETWRVVCNYHKKKDPTVKGECNICARYKRHGKDGNC